MRLWKKILLALFAVILLAQIPFVYRRYQYGQLAGKINSLQTQRNEIADKKFNDFAGVIHVHTLLGGHSTGNFDELVEGAAKNNLDFVVMTEHTAEFYDTSALTLNGVFDGVLFVNGQEVETATDRFLLVPGSADSNRANKISTAEFLQNVRAENKLAFVTYPEKHKTWDADFDGIEVFSLHTNAKKMNPFLAVFDCVWSFYSYPELVLANYFERPRFCVFTDK